MPRHRDLLAFADRMDELAKEVPKASNRLAIEVALAILRDFAYVTPVDTSAALSNWQVSLSNRTNREIGAHYLGSLGSSRSASAQMVIALGSQNLMPKRPGQTIWIVNNISYIGDLNRGSSRQFAGGFEARARAIAHRVVTRTGIKL